MTLTKRPAIFGTHEQEKDMKVHLVWLLAVAIASYGSYVAGQFRYSYYKQEAETTKKRLQEADLLIAEQQTALEDQLRIRKDLTRKIEDLQKELDDLENPPEKEDPVQK